MDLGQVRDRLEEVQRSTPASTLVSPLSGLEIMELTGQVQGIKIGQIKKFLTEQVLEGLLAPDDKPSAIRSLQERFGANLDGISLGP